MTQEEILEYNKRCAEFLNFKYRNSKKAWGKYPLDNNSFLALKGWLSMDRLQFHSDWNWIMEVVEAIEKNKFLIDKERPYYITIDNNYCGIFFNRWNDKGKDFGGTKQIVSIKADSKKEAVVQAINQFLIWYNENNT